MIIDGDASWGHPTRFGMRSTGGRGLGFELTSSEHEQGPEQGGFS